MLGECLVAAAPYTVKQRTGSILAAFQAPRTPEDEDEHAWGCLFAERSRKRGRSATDLATRSLGDPPSNTALQKGRISAGSASSVLKDPNRYQKASQQLMWAMRQRLINTLIAVIIIISPQRLQVHLTPREWPPSGSVANKHSLT